MISSINEELSKIAMMMYSPDKMQFPFSWLPDTLRLWMNKILCIRQNQELLVASPYRTRKLIHKEENG